MTRQVKGVEGKRVGVVISGGNADPPLLKQIL
jgi:threonine dehydratase